MPKIVATEEDWIIHGLEQFAGGGVSAINVEAISRELGCAKSSFYWHFKNRKTFLNRVLGYWASQHTEGVIERTNFVVNAWERLHFLVMGGFNIQGRQDFLIHLRRLARTDETAASFLDEVETRRLSYIATLIQETGIDEEESWFLSELVYHHFLGWNERNRDVQLSEEQVDALSRKLLRSIGLAPPGSTPS